MNSNTVKKLFAALLALVILLLCAACSETEADPTDPPYEPKVFETPILRFAVTSDVHIRSEVDNKESHARLTALYETVYAYCDAQTDYSKLDGIFFVGDNTNRGNEEEQTYFFNYLRDHTRAQTLSRAVMGNHEFASSNAERIITKATAEFLKYSGYESADAHLMIGGYHFIFLSMDRYIPSMESLSEGKLAWLEQELAAAAAEDPSKPIFVFNHMPPTETVVGSSIGDGNLNAIFAKYPQVIDFAGHSHLPISNLRSVWQGDYTVFNTGSLAFLSVAIPDHDTRSDGGASAIDQEGGWAVENAHGVRNAGMYYIVEVDQNNTVRVLVYNLFTNSLWGEPIIIDSFVPEHFQYTDARKDSAAAPVFDTNAALTVESVNSTEVALTIPQAACRDVVQSYRVELYEGDTKVDYAYRLAGTYYGDAAPEAVKAYFENLKSATEYTVKVYAVSSWAAESEPLVGKFTTDAA